MMGEPDTTPTPSGDPDPTPTTPAETPVPGPETTPPPAEAPEKPLTDEEQVARALKDVGYRADSKEGEKPDGKPEKAVEKAVEKFKFKVLEEDVELTREEVQERLGQADLAGRSQKRFEEAATARKEAQQLRQDAQHVVNAVKSRGADVLVDLLAADIGDEDIARERVIEHLMQWLAPHLEERRLAQTDPARYWAIKAQKETTKREKLSAEHQRRESERVQNEEMTRSTHEQKRAALEFENKIVAELTKVGVPNDEVTETIYRKAKAIADESGITLTPTLAANLIKQRRDTLLGAKSPTPVASQEAQNVSITSSPEFEKQRLENLAKAREKLAEGRRAERKHSSERDASDSPRARRRFTTDDLREKIGI